MNLYKSLRAAVPDPLFEAAKRVTPAWARARVHSLLSRVGNEQATRHFELSPPLPTPEGVSEAALFDYLSSVCVEDAPPSEMANYCRESFRRFVYTWSLVRDRTGSCLELGANPYFTTMLLRQFTPLELTLANYFGPGRPPTLRQRVNYREWSTGRPSSVEFESSLFNTEDDPFPFADQSFDVVLFCEIIEHLLMDPLKVLGEIRRVLRPGGQLVLTTPNVARLENVARLATGANIYDPYSGYGPYGRHNREYTAAELTRLLKHAGFEVQSSFTADVHPNLCADFVPPQKLAPILEGRDTDLGQYIFVRAARTGRADARKPSFLYRSYPADALA